MADLSAANISRGGARRTVWGGLPLIKPDIFVRFTASSLYLQPLQIEHRAWQRPLLEEGALN